MAQRLWDKLLTRCGESSFYARPAAATESAASVIAKAIFFFFITQSPLGGPLWMDMVRVRSPGVLMIGSAYGLVLVLAAILAVALHMPSVGVSFPGEGRRVLATTAAGQVTAVLAPDAR